MKKRFAIFILPGLFVLLLWPGCKQQDVETSMPGVVEANAAYTKNFGQPPSETVTMSLSLQGTFSAIDLMAAANVLTETAVQFPAIKRSGFS